ncbi:MAG: hypothetical protein CMN30_15280 [Sandaracinus sp.]|nr:hypothetical protein [Sandaracinus sp.]
MRVALLLLLLAGCATSEPEHSGLRLVALAQGPGALHVQVCPEDADSCDDLTVTRGTVSDALELVPGIHEIRVSATEDGPVLSRFEYGFGPGAEYALALYGVADEPTHVSWTAEAKDLLGGIDEPFVAGFQLAHRMVPLRPPDADEAGEVRLVHGAPGAQPVRGTLALDSETIELPAVPYGAMGEAVRVERASGRLTLSFEGSPLDLAHVDLEPRPGTLTVVYVGAIEDGSLEVFTDRVGVSPR